MVGPQNMAKVLIIDDDHAYAGMLKRQTIQLGHEVLHCETWLEGQASVRSFEPDIVLLDVWLPDGNALGHIQELKSALSLPEVLVITGAGDEAAAELAIRAGVWDYWQKDRTIGELMSALGRMVEHRMQCERRRHGQALDRHGLVAQSPVMVDCFGELAQAAISDVPVLIHGETGTGKEKAAQVIHKNSARAQKPFVVVDCAALTENLVESILFGHDKGAFTGASTDRTGLVRQAHEGTLFLDEVGELPASVQKAFLRVLQEKRFRAVGSDRVLMSDFRLVAATNRDLRQMVEAGAFRADLYFRLRSMEIVLPPLRDRGDDGLLIAKETVAMACQRLSLPGKSLSPSLVQALARYPWPGNVRELRQAIECAVVSAGQATTLDTIHLPTPIRVQLARASLKLHAHRGHSKSTSDYRTLADTRDAVTATYLTRLMEDTQGDIDAACRFADVSRSRLYELLKVHGVARTAPAKDITEMRAAS
jgi:two-component system, NtrC family, response regulator